MGGGGSRSGGDGGGRAANNGGMSRGSSSSGSRGSSNRSNSASPSRSTPGSPNASDGRRGASLGSSGGSARASNASPSRSTPGSPNAADGKRGASMGRTGGSAGSASPSSHPGRPGGEANQRSFVNGSSTGGSDSIRGASDAKRSYGFDTNAIRDALVRDREVRDAPVNMMDDADIAPAELNQDVLALVKDKDRQELSDRSREARESMMAETISPPDIARVTNLHNEQAMQAVADANDDGALRGIAETAIGAVTGLPVGLIADAVENSRAAKSINNAREGLASQFGISADSLGKVTGGDIGSVSIGDTTGGLIGNTNAVTNAIAGTAKAPSKRSLGGKGNNVQPVTPPSPVGPAPASPSNAPQSPTASEFGAGEVNGYASYARRVFSRV